MIDSPKESDIPLKQEGHHSSDHHEKAKAPSSASTSQWLRLKDPRIVRVSRAFGGKDRHSKVCTIRGLRDRRVRLSVPTAIQLYDLQDRLGLNQPSKVVDWLLNAAKHEIDELPPLPSINIPPPGSNFTLGFPSSMITTSNTEASPSQHNHNNEQVLFNNSINRSIQWGEGSSQNSISLWKPKSKEASSEQGMVAEKANWMNKSSSSSSAAEEAKQGSNKEGQGAHVFGGNSNSSTLLPIIRPNHPSFLGLLNTMPLGGYQWEPPSSGDVANQLGNHGFTNQSDLQHINVVPFPSTLSLTTPQFLVCPPGSSTQSYFPTSSHVTAATELDPRQISHYHQMLNSGSQNLLTTSSLNPSSFSLAMMTPKLLHSPNTTRESPPHHKDHDFPSK